MSGFVHEIFSFTPSDKFVVLKCKVTPSQKLREEPRNAWILCSKEGEVLCANCSCTAGFGECCNHVVAMLYKVEFANSHGLIDPACTAKACEWNKRTEKEVEPQKIRDVIIRKHESVRKAKRRIIQSDFKKSFDVRPVEKRDDVETRLGAFIEKLPVVMPLAVARMSIAPPKMYACPPSLPDIAEHVLVENPGADEQILIGKLTEALSFNEKQLAELEKTTRAQAGSSHWRRQRVGCVTGTKIRDVFTKMNSIARSRGKSGRVTPLLAKFFKDTEIGSIPAVKFGREHEEDARKAFHEKVVAKHERGKLLSSGLVASQAFPYIRASPDNVFTCACCKVKPMPVEYKCPFKIREKTVIEGFKELDFLKEDTDGSIHLKKQHKYYSQLTAQTALLGAEAGFFVVWTENGDPFVEKVPFDEGHWAEMERNAVIFFKTHIARVLLKERVIYFCPLCDKPCLEPDEIEKAEENSVECSWCNQWHHWPCVNIKSSPNDEWVCEGCINHALNSDVNIL